MSHHGEQEQEEPPSLLYDWFYSSNFCWVLSRRRIKQKRSHNPAAALLFASALSTGCTCILIPHRSYLPTRARADREPAVCANPLHAVLPDIFCRKLLIIPQKMSGKKTMFYSCSHPFKPANFKFLNEGQAVTERTGRFETFYQSMGFISHGKCLDKRSS